MAGEKKMESRNQDDRYLTDEYVTQNPTWDEQDSPWKAVQVNKILEANNLQPHSIWKSGVEQEEFCQNFVLFWVSKYCWMDLTLLRLHRSSGGSIDQRM